jgi:hypothetical protein
LKAAETGRPVPQATQRKNTKNKSKISIRTCAAPEHFRFFSYYRHITGARVRPSLALIRRNQHSPAPGLTMRPLGIFNNDQLIKLVGLNQQRKKLIISIRQLEKQLFPYVTPGSWRTLTIHHDPATITHSRIMVS